MKNNTPKLIIRKQQNTTKIEKSKQGIASSSNFHDHQPSPLLAFFVNHTMQNISFISVTSHPTFQLGDIQIVKKPKHMSMPH
jgi:hypothetical protein